MSYDHESRRALPARIAVVLAACAGICSCAAGAATSSPSLTSGQCGVTETRCAADSDCCSNWCVNQYCANREP